MSEARVACPDCTVDCDGQHHEINYCPVHEAGPVLLKALEGIVEYTTERLLSKSVIIAEARAAIAQANGPEREWRSMCCGAPPWEYSDVGSDNLAGICGDCRDNTGFELVEA